LAAGVDRAPRAAIVASGSELVRGDRTDRNGPYLAAELPGHEEQHRDGHDAGEGDHHPAVRLPAPGDGPLAAAEQLVLMVRVAEARVVLVDVQLPVEPEVVGVRP